MNQAILAAPIDQQEVWAAGVTYMRSRDARMEESTRKVSTTWSYDATGPSFPQGHAEPGLRTGKSGRNPE